MKIGRKNPFLSALNKTKEHRELVSRSRKGVSPWIKGKKGVFSVEMLKKISRLGCKHTEETKRKISLTMKGKKKSLEAREKMKITQKKICNYPEVKLKRSLDNRGEKSHFWKGGIAYRKYPYSWTKTLKQAIRERDNYTCVCGEKQDKQTFSVHHIDYDKDNCNPVNLITLCYRCHGKTTINRDYWKVFLTKYLLEKHGTH